MILSDKSIRQAIVDDVIGVDPSVNEKQIQPASLDVRLGNKFASFDGEDTVHFERDKIRLTPGKRYLGTTKETIDLPNDIAAQLAGRSTIGRKGVIVHKTAGWVDPSFSGTITLELMNLGREPVTIEEGERVAQLVFFELDSPSSGYDGHYQNQSGATKAYND